MGKEMISLDEFSGGALAEKFNEELEKVLKNINDPNTDGKKARKINIEITIKPNQKRNAAAVIIQTKSALAPITPIETNIMIDKDMRTGGLVAAEFGGCHRDQIAMDFEDHTDEEETAEEGKVNGIIDFRKVGSAE